MIVNFKRLALASVLALGGLLASGASAQAGGFHRPCRPRPCHPPICRPYRPICRPWPRPCHPRPFVPVPVPVPVPTPAPVFPYGVL